MNITIPVLPLWQPWASAMEVLDKRVETRGWVVKHRGLFAIHATKKWDNENRPLLSEPQFTGVREAYPDGEDLPLGGIVAIAIAVECLPAAEFLKRPGFIGSLEHALGLYEDGEHPRFGLVTAGLVRVRPFIPFKGSQQTFAPWRVDADELARYTGGATCCVNAEQTMMGCLRCGYTVLKNLAVFSGTATCPGCAVRHRLPPASMA